MPKLLLQNLDNGVQVRYNNRAFGREYLLVGGANAPPSHLEQSKRSNVPRLNPRRSPDGSSASDMIVLLRAALRSQACLFTPGAWPSRRCPGLPEPDASGAALTPTGT